MDNVRNLLTRGLLWAVGRLNPYKDEALASRLHQMSQDYRRRPTDDSTREEPSQRQV